MTLKEINNKCCFINFNDVEFRADTFYQFKVNVLNYIKKQVFGSDVEAMRFLTNRDPMLSRSLKLAKKQNYQLEEISSQVLATLLMQHLITNEWDNWEAEIENYFKNEKV